MKRREFILNTAIFVGGTALLAGCGKKEIYIPENSISRRKFKDLSIPLLALGCMRLPTKNGEINQAEVERMVEYCMQHGANYFDTAYMYMDGKSENAIGKALKKYERNSFMLTDKNPIMMLNSEDDVLKIFNDQLKKCQVDYFDLYMAHNINKDTYDKYREYNVFEHLEQMKKQGKIKHLGFSFHGDLEMLKKVVKEHKWEFCQLQLNYYDWDVMQMKELYKVATDAKLPIIVMEPLRGGGLCKLNDKAQKELSAVAPKETPISYAFKWLASKPEIFTILSGMSNLEQVKENIATFTDLKPLTEEQVKASEKITKAIQAQGAVNCTGCKYCIDSCPRGVNIPAIFAAYNNYKLFGNAWLFNNDYTALPEDQRANMCINCGACVKHCPQSLPIPKLLAQVDKEAKAIAEQMNSMAKSRVAKKVR